MMIAKDTQFSAVKAFIHWYLLMCAGLLVGGGALMLLAELSPLLVFGKGNEVFSGVIAIAGLAWVVWTAWYIGHRDGYTKRVLPMPASARAVGMVGVAAVGNGFGSGFLHDDYFRPRSDFLMDGKKWFDNFYDDDD